MAKNSPFIVNGWYPWFKKRVKYLNCIEGKWGWKIFTEVHKMPRYLWIYYKISFVRCIHWSNWFSPIIQISLFRLVEIIRVKPIEMLYSNIQLSLRWRRHLTVVLYKQGRKRPLDTPKRMIERREREGKREKER